MQSHGSATSRMSSSLYAVMLIMVLSGASNVLLKEYMAMVRVPTGRGDEEDTFNRPVLWSLLMKGGMSLCIIFNCNRPAAPVPLFVFSSFLGLVADVLVNMAYFAMAGSAIQMLRGGKIVFTALLRRTFLNQQMQNYQVVGTSLVVLGITFVGISAHLTPARRVLGEMSTTKHLDDHQAVWIATGFCFIAEVCQAVLWVYQERILKAYDIPPLQLVGMEGMIGLVLGGALITASHSLELENLRVSAHQLSVSLPLVISVIAMLIAVALFNYSGVSVTKNGSSVARAVLDVARSSVIWTVELVLGWHAFNWFQFSGYIVLVVGVLLYNRLIVVPGVEESPEAETEQTPMVEKKAGLPGQ